jgi:hypothetical protein
MLMRMIVLMRMIMLMGVFMHVWSGHSCPRSVLIGRFMPMMTVPVIMIRRFSRPVFLPPNQNVDLSGSDPTAIHTRNLDPRANV